MLFYHYWAESAIPAGTGRILSGSLPRIGARATVLIAGLAAWGQFSLRSLILAATGTPRHENWVRRLVDEHESHWRFEPVYQYVACDPACAPSCRYSAKSEYAYQLRDKSYIVRRGFKRIERLGYRVTIEADQHYFSSQ